MNQTNPESIPAAQDAFNAADDNEPLQAPDIVSEKLEDTQTPGYQAEFDPDEADAAGAFFDDGLSEDDAIASTSDTAYGARHSTLPET